MAEEEEDVKVEAKPPRQLKERSRELVNNKTIEDTCMKIFKDIEQGFVQQWDRCNQQLEYWDCYNCVLSANQFYSGNSKIYAPLVRDAIEARKTRFVNQVFPVSGKHIELQASEGRPQAILSLLEFYIRKSKLRTKVMPPLLKNGDIEGQYNIYISWSETERNVVHRVHRKPVTEGIENPLEEEYDDIEEETVIHGYPRVEVLSDMDVLVLPFTADSTEDALQSGGSVTVIRRWSKTQVRKLIRDGDIDKDRGQALLREMASILKQNMPNKRKNINEASGIELKDGKSTAHCFETWARIKVDGDLRLCRMYYGGQDRVLGVKLNPNWNDKCPLLSAPVDKLGDAFKGQSKVKPVASYQYGANDFLNEGMDSGTFSLMPIVMTDPTKNPRSSSMVLNVAAIWETSPNDTKFAQFPSLWKDAIMIVSGFKEQIFQSLGVNPAMIPQGASGQGKKQNQAQLATEQQVDILTTADVVTNLEGEILTPMLTWFLALDHQHRNKSMTIRAFGPMGVKAEMEEIEPVQMDRRYEFRWYGVEQARSAQQQQLQMATLNVLRSIGPQDTPGYKKDLTPIIEQMVENVWGPRVAPLVFTDVRKEMTLPVEFENLMLEAGYSMAVHPMDNDAEHMQAHFKAMQEGGDYHGTFRKHLVLHQMSMQQKQQAMVMQQAQMLMQGRPGAPGGAGPGAAGTPRGGAMTTAPRGGQQPPGAMHRDRMPLSMPRPTRG